MTLLPVFVVLGVRRWTTETRSWVHLWPDSEAPVITHHSRPVFSLPNMHKGGLKHHPVHFTYSCIFVLKPSLLPIS